MDTFYPRLIVWHLSDAKTVETFSTQECLLTIESIAKVSKPIVVLTGAKVLGRPDIYQIIEYGFALGLKMIVEALLRELTDDVVRRFKVFGPKVFRVLVDESIVEDNGTRYRQTPFFRELEDAVLRLKNTGYELHLVATIASPDLRKFAFYHDYAFRRSAQGLYCHLHINGTHTNGNARRIDEFIEAIARMKTFSPKQMYVSPQCVKYGLNHAAGSQHHYIEVHAEEGNAEWKQWCLAGRSFAFINPTGKVQMCGGIQLDCGDLRANNFDFKTIWESSELLDCVRARERSCEDMRSCINQLYSVQVPDVKS